MPCVGPLRVLQKMFSPIICFERVVIDVISNWGGESIFNNQMGPKLTEEEQSKSSLPQIMFLQTETGS